jgi:myo-inositol 2-dehydrogenase/D-chiro-inositol 1-dehydrogenase
MRVAFIGAGKMATGLMRCVDKVEDVEVTAVCDIDASAAEAAATPHDAAVLTDHERLFADHEFDVVFIAIPPFAYEDQATLAVEHGVDLFVEKPVALRPADAVDVEETIEGSDIVTSSGYVFRYDRITEHALDLIGDREISLLDGKYWSGLLASPWGNEMDISGGDINVRATHLYDLLRYFGGEVDRVFAAGSDRLGMDAIDYDEAVTSTVEHENGVVSHVSSALTAPEWTVEFDITGDGFQLHLDYVDQSLTGVIDDEPVAFDGQCDRYLAEVETFFEASRTDSQQLVRSSYADAARTLELNWAVIESAERGEPVVLP